MKKNFLFLVMLLCFGMTIIAQENIENRIYKLDSVTSWASATLEQKTQLKTLLKTRKDSLVNADGIKQKTINKVYFQNIENIFDENQKKKIVAH